MTIGGAISQLQELIDNGWINPIAQPAVKKVIETIQMELQAEPETNADRIRAMTDEELANELGFIVDAFYYGRGLRDNLRLYPFKSYKEILKWLKQEANS